jgi:hypothetical protein
MLIAYAKKGVDARIRDPKDARLGQGNDAHSLAYNDRWAPWVRKIP